MKFFQYLTLSISTLLLFVPFIAEGTEVYINNDSAFTEKSVNQSRLLGNIEFSDIFPGDWAYIALEKLSKTTRCKNTLYTQSIKDDQPLTRYEAAALINSCIDGNIALYESNSDTLRLLNEFGTEMSILKGRTNAIYPNKEEISM